MNNIELRLQDGRGAFFIKDAGKVLAEMVFGISNSRLTVFHTEVSENLKGQGIGKKLLDEMVKYAREHQLKVIPLCPYVSAMFRKHPELYEDIWQK